MTATRTETKEERALHEAAAGLNLTLRVDGDSSGRVRFFLANAANREMEISPEAVRCVPPGHLHVTLAAFAIGATAIHFGRRVLTIETNPTPEAHWPDATPQQDRS